MDNEIQLLVIGPNKKNGSGSAKIREFSKSHRLMSALKKSGVCILGAIIGALIPVLHFVVVPALLIGAFFSFVFTYKKKAIILEPVATCPVCSNALSIGQVEPNWPLAVTCPKCKTQLYVQDGALQPLISISTQ